jgi:RNA polymerase sigma factor (sigma-70 family)
MSEHGDRELVERARRGDAAAIGELFSRYWRAARAAAFGVTGELASAEDAAAEAFRQALGALDSLRDPDRFGPWLRTIVVRKARLELQIRHLPADALVEDLSDQNERPDDALERLELGALIQHAVRELPDRLREAMALVYFEGYDSEDAARFLDIPAGTLRRRLHEGRGQVRSAVEQLLRGSKRMNADRERHIQKFKSLIDDGAIYRALRESLALRPPPSELIDRFVRRHMASANDSQEVVGGKDHREWLRPAVQRFTGPSDRATDSNHPVGAMAAAIRKALPDFQDWPLDVGEAAARFFTGTGEYRDRLRAVLPPGFAEGRPGAFLRATRGLLRVTENGPVQSIYELLQTSPDEATFRTAKNDMRISDVLDLTWMVAGPLELRSVQELLERLRSALLPQEQVRFSPYDEPRYRSALQLHVGGRFARFAHGGVLAEWPGRPQGVDAAHLRIFLEPWATVQSGRVVEFHQLPEMPFGITRD